MSRNYDAERERGAHLAGPLAHLLEAVALDLCRNESLHLHDVIPAGACGYCYLRGGRTLGIVAKAYPPAAPAPAQTTEGGSRG